MNLKNYFFTNFWKDLEGLKCQAPNETILEQPTNFFIHKGIKFFGGKDWGNFEDDTKTITNKEEFILTLFVLSTVDYFIKNNLELYENVRQKYDPPKLGWSGFGPHFEHPIKIFSRCFSEFFRMQERAEEIVELFKEIVCDYETLDYDSLTAKIINNEINSIEKYHAFLELLEKPEEDYWKAKMKLIFE